MIIIFEYKSPRSLANALLKSPFNTNLTMLTLVVIVFLSLSLANPISFNISNTSLLKRAVPANQGCDPGDEWLGRFCDGDIGPGAYRDECESEAENYFVQFQCDGDAECFEYEDADNDQQIDCITVPRTPDKDDIVTTKLQYGKRKFNIDPTPNLERIVSVQLQEGFGPSTSVSAHLMG
jgi:hypothetical protein